jgi:hypothetical protein
MHAACMNRHAWTGMHEPAKKGQKKSILIFLAIFCLHFWLRLPDAVLMNTVSKDHVHRSEVNIYRVMTRNESAVFNND